MHPKGACIYARVHARTPQVCACVAHSPLARFWHDHMCAQVWACGYVFRDLALLRSLRFGCIFVARSPLRSAAHFNPSGLAFGLLKIKLFSENLAKNEGSTCAACVQLHAYVHVHTCVHTSARRMYILDTWAITKDLAWKISFWRVGCTFFFGQNEKKLWKNLWKFSQISRDFIISKVIYENNEWKS